MVHLSKITGVNRLHKIKVVMKTQYLQRFIRLFPTYKSHYSRKHNQNRNYLPPTLQMSTMYKKYVCNCNENDRTPLSIFVFRRIFNTKFNIHFHHPQSDTCQKCDLFNNKIRCLSEGEEKNTLWRDLIIHQEMAEKANEKMKEDTLDAHTNPNKRVLVFDLQKTLPTPVLSTGIAYYKRQMWTYILGIHDKNLKTGFMYVWSEEQVSRGTQEIGSCIPEHVFVHIPETVTHLILYSDSCGGQNRNIKMSLMLQYILHKSPFLKTIEQKFFVPGHSFSSCDQIFVPDHWIDLLKNAKKRAPILFVRKMETHEFLSTKSLESGITNRKKLTNGEKVSWLKTCWIKLEKGSPRSFQMKQTHLESDTFMLLDVTKRFVGDHLPLSMLNLSPCTPMVENSQGKAK